MEKEEAMKILKDFHDKSALFSVRTALDTVFPELAESEDEKIRKAIIATIHLYYGEPLEDEAKDMIAWLEKQGEQETDEWKEGNIIRHGGILALVIRGRRVMKSNGEIFTVQYPDEWVKAAPKEIEHFLNEFEKQGEQPQGKTALEAAKEEKVDNQNCVKPVDKVEPKFKVKYAGNEYNVFETKDIAGVTFYGIEDEPNHIDYVKAENCEIISVYAIKENGSPYPTKPAVFSEKKPKRMISAEAKEAMYDKPACVWSEEDKQKINDIVYFLDTAKKHYASTVVLDACIDWLKSLKQRMEEQQ